MAFLFELGYGDKLEFKITYLLIYLSAVKVS